jgi:hypothetical protein
MKSSNSIKPVATIKEPVINTELNTIEKEYINGFDEKELKAYNIAKSYLGSSFHLIKSNGFIEWSKK